MPHKLLMSDPNGSGYGVAPRARGAHLLAHGPGVDVQPPRGCTPDQLVACGGCAAAQRLRHGPCTVWAGGAAAVCRRLAARCGWAQPLQQALQCVKMPSTRGFNAAALWRAFQCADWHVWQELLRCSRLTTLQHEVREPTFSGAMPWPYVAKASSCESLGMPPQSNSQVSGGALSAPLTPVRCSSECSLRNDCMAQSARCQCPG